MTQEKPRSGAHTGGSEGPLDEKVAAWLQKEGYPLEFDTARAFQRAGFTVLQSEYTEPRPDRPRREVDVVAHISQRNEQLLRAEHVIECKWSGDKPWVFFCGGGGMTTAAAVTQTIASRLGEALLWKEAGNPALAALGIFRSEHTPAFGGKQAFSKSPLCQARLRQLPPLDY